MAVILGLGLYVKFSRETTPSTYTWTASALSCGGLSQRRCVLLPCLGTHYNEIYIWWCMRSFYSHVSFHSNNAKKQHENKVLFICSLSVKVFALDPVDRSSIPTRYALKQGSWLLIASVDSAANEYRPSGWGGALRQTDVLARGEWQLLSCFTSLKQG